MYAYLERKELTYVEKGSFNPRNGILIRSMHTYCCRNKKIKTKNTGAVPLTKHSLLHIRAYSR